MDDALALVGYTERHDVEPVRGELPRKVTRARYYLGSHGPFDVTWDHDPTPAETHQEIAARRDALRQKLLA